MAEQLPHQGKNVRGLGTRVCRSDAFPNDAAELANLDEAILDQMDQIQKEVRLT